MTYECSYCEQYGISVLDESVTYKEMNLFFDYDNQITYLRHATSLEAEYRVIEEYPYDGNLTSKQAFEWLDILKQYQSKIDKMRAFL